MQQLRSRIIQPGFFSNDELCELPFETRIYFEGLWCVADKEGRLKYRPKRLKALIFPYDDVNIDAMTDSLVEYDFVYFSPDGKYLQITNWRKHQKPHWNETESEIEEFQRDNYKEPNKPLESSLKVSKSKIKSINKSKSKNSDIPFEEIVSHLNLVANTNFQSTGKKTQSMIRARWAEGFRLEDFLYVHKIKTSEWLNTDMEKFLRPETLYSNKFEGYRQQKPHKDLKTPITSQQEQKHYESKKRVLPKLPSEQQYWNNLTSEEQTEWRNLPIPKKTISEFYIERHGELCLSR